MCELEGSISHLAQQSSMRKRELESYRGLAEGVLSVASATDATVEKARERVKMLSTSRTLDGSSSNGGGGGGKDAATGQSVRQGGGRREATADWRAAAD